MCLLSMFTQCENTLATSGAFNFKTFIIIIDLQITPICYKKRTSPPIRLSPRWSSNTFVTIAAMKLQKDISVRMVCKQQFEAVPRGKAGGSVIHSINDLDNDSKDSSGNNNNDEGKEDGSV